MQWEVSRGFCGVTLAGVLAAQLVEDTAHTLKQSRIQFRDEALLIQADELLE